MYASSSLIYFDQLANLCTHSKFEYFLIGAWSNAHLLTTATPMMCVSKVGGEFITQYLKLKPAMLAKHFNAYAMNRGVMICRTCYHVRVHLAILHICDMRALDATDRDALTARCGLLFMGLVAFCLYNMRCVYK
jgi:hypothetical protein